VTLRRAAIPFHVFARARAERVNELTSSGTRRLSMQPPRDPSQVPDGDLGDAIKPGNPTPSDFNDDGEEETLEDMEDDTGFLADDEEDDD
jgi:hypothetical protein